MELGLPIRNMITEYPDYCEIALTGGETMKVDKVDLPIIEATLWSNSQGYAHGQVNGEIVRFHNYVLDQHELNVSVDHFDMQIGLNLW